MLGRLSGSDCDERCGSGYRGETAPSAVHVCAACVDDAEGATGDGTVLGWDGTSGKRSIVLMPKSDDCPDLAQYVSWLDLTTWRAAAST